MMTTNEAPTGAMQPSIDMGAAAALLGRQGLCHTHFEPIAHMRRLDQILASRR
jgi:hypothetical protein